MSYPARRRVPVASANMVPLGGGRGGAGPAAPPPAKRARTGNSGQRFHFSPAAGVASGHCEDQGKGVGGSLEFAGKTAEKMFPDVRQGGRGEKRGK